MSRSIFGGVLVLLAVLLFLAFSALYTVHQTQQVLVLRFGDIQDVVTEPGLHFKVPLVDNVVHIDKRILDLNTPVQEVIASDQRRLVVDAFARYRINDALRFYQAVGSIEAADSRLATILNSALRRVLGEQSFFAVVRDNRDALMQEITKQVNREAETLGVEVVDVRIRRADLPQANAEAIFRRMQTEREQEAAQIRAEGEEQARRIRSRADRDTAVIVAEANRESEQVRGEGDAQRSAIYADAYGRDADFYSFYRSMQAYEVGLSEEGTRLVLSPNSDFFRYFGDLSGTVRPPAGAVDPEASPELSATQPDEAPEPSGAGTADASPAQ